ncbi:hypothetical protein [Deinococcus knuensis]|uniref:Uncharacterized protein n=1 Tax=Deinococcus knuensis TaxID=1837380 RepID=A0ABQ2SGF4_9DEIO|nr:hypothetical protein [Deinococcus knuensis]GGS25375.1 hypothetical protein GCM10008961_16020 [Deinococcus knuensis]
MCHSFSLLSSDGQQCRVLRCTCGSLHVLWHALSLSLNHQEFAQLSALLASSDPHGDAPTGRWQRGDWELRRTDHAAQLWCGPAGLTFTPGDFQALCALIHAVTLPPTPAAPGTAMHLN